MAIGNGVLNGHGRFDSSSTVPLHIDGKEVTTDTTFDVTSPVDGKVDWKSSSANEKDALKAVESAQKAFKTWSKTTAKARPVSGFCPAHMLICMLSNGTTSS